jgi:hypothetical protein
MNIQRVGADTILLIVDDNTLSAGLIENAKDLCYEIGSCKSLIAVVGVDEMREKPCVLDDRWTGHKLTDTHITLRFEIRRTIPALDNSEPPRPPRPARPRPARPPRPTRLSQPARKKLAGRKLKKRRRIIR